jgi:ADP-ribose diphosphatase
VTARTFTHPSVLEGIADGAEWADPMMDPAEIDWTERRKRAAIPFKVVDGRPLNPFAPTGTRYGRNEFGHWGEALMADALVTVALPACPVPFLLMVERGDGHGWAAPGGHVEDETGLQAALRELAEETGLSGVPRSPAHVMPARYVPDPRASDEAWAVTIPAHVDLGTLATLPPVRGGDDALRAAWIPAGDYRVLTAALGFLDPENGVFGAHVPMLTEFLGE